MTNKEMEDFLLDDDSDEDTEAVQLDFDQIKSNIHEYSNNKLCEMIVCDRYFGFEQKISIVCMEELARRRLAGDTFQYEDRIASISKELPELHFEGIPDIRTILNQAISQKINSK